jgi:hypothetical protein
MTVRSRLSRRVAYKVNQAKGTQNDDPEPAHCTFYKYDYHHRHVSLSR